MTAEQWLADMEAKAKAATPGPWEIGVCLDRRMIRQRDGSILAYCRLTTDDDIHNAAFISSANPATVLRLVGMVRFLAFSAARSRGLFMDPAYWIDTAYIATETRHDQN